jgi:3-oxoacyl-[acyl-carrier protein] reductase
MSQTAASSQPSRPHPSWLDQLAWQIALMCTPAASFVSGVILDVNGGSYVA